MTLYRGTAALNGNNVLIKPPQGFGAINGLRLTNYTGETLLINNISSTGQGEEFLFPQQQMVYHTRNISAAPTAQGFFTHEAFPPSKLFVEWSDDSINDFIGQYPAFLPQTEFINPALGSPIILATTIPTTVATTAPPNFFDYSIDFNSVDGVQAPGPLVIPTGFAMALNNIQISASYMAPPFGVQQFTISLAEVVAGAITRIYASSAFTLNASAINDTPTSTHNVNYSPTRNIPAGATPVWIYQNGPAGVAFAATANGTLLPS
jgi:hypothetical protein